MTMNKHWFMLGTFLQAHRVRPRSWTDIDLVHTYLHGFEESGKLYLAAEESRLFEESLGTRSTMILRDRPLRIAHYESPTTIIIELP
jgi:hypothetical protein